MGVGWSLPRNWGNFVITRLRPMSLVVITLAAASSTDVDDPCAGAPSDWLSACKNAELFYHASPDDGPVVMPEIANGYVGTLAKSDTLYTAGLYNCDARATATQCGGKASYRAALPVFHVVPNVTATSAALDVARAPSSSSAAPSASGSSRSARLMAKRNREDEWAVIREHQRDLDEWSIRIARGNARL